MKNEKKIAEFKSKTKAELEKLVVEFRAKVWQYRIDIASGKTKNAKDIRTVKKAIARALTVLSAQAIAGK